MLERLSIARRIMAGFCIVLALCAALAGFSVWQSLQMANTFNDYRATAIQNIGVFSNVEALDAAQAAALGYSLSPNAERAEEVRASLTQLSAATSEAAALFDDGNAQDLQSLGRDVQAYRDGFEQVVQKQAEITEILTAFSERGEEIREAFNAAKFAIIMGGDAGAGTDIARAKELFLDARYEVSAFVSSKDETLFDKARRNLSEASSVADTLSKRATGGLKDQAEGLAGALAQQVEALAPLKDVVLAQHAEKMALYEEIGPSLRTMYISVLEEVTTRQKELDGVQTAAFKEATIISGALGAAALAIGAVLAYAIGLWISGAVAGMARSMTKLADNNLDIVIRGGEHQHELGAMARALAVFRDNAGRVSRLNQERVEAEQASAEARRAMMNELQAEFGAVVDAAIAGDLSVRADAKFTDQELNVLADGVNRLLDTVEAGVAETGRVLSCVAEGGLNERMQGDFSGAFAELQTNVNVTVGRLSEMIAKIVEASGAMQTRTGEIHGAAGDMSKRAESQAAAVEETAAAMEQINSAIDHSASNAHAARNLVDEANNRANRGGEIVDGAGAALTEIEADASKIGDIITVIDGIAFQTNLLALNAAVEAARAGEAGRGFAVVAQEVRSLAQRSADAASEVRGLITDSSQRVGEGVRLVRETKQALEQITEAVGQVADKISDISRASNEQTESVREVTGAVSHIDGITQKTSSAAEATASVADRLTHQAEELRQIVSFFSAAQQPSIEKAA
ncbi:MAG: methyl-accepting chemotaxis protein [Rhodobacteraceae bacterium]|nr:methyl-accepting chemotaxis protein [Paracoccaceae bacterium]